MSAPLLYCIPSFVLSWVRFLARVCLVTSAHVLCQISFPFDRFLSWPVILTSPRTSITSVSVPALSYFPCCSFSLRIPVSLVSRRFFHLLSALLLELPFVSAIGSPDVRHVMTQAISITAPRSNSVQHRSSHPTVPCLVAAINYANLGCNLQCAPTVGVSPSSKTILYFDRVRQQTVCDSGLQIRPCSPMYARLADDCCGEAHWCRCSATPSGRCLLHEALRV